MADPSEAVRLPRSLGLGDAVVIGLGSMIGAGVFAAIGPAAAAAGAGLLYGLAVAAIVAYANATSSAQLAAVYPEAGGTYVYGRERLGAFWGFMAGWSFVVGKTASLAVMAITVGAYAVPGYEHVAGVVAVTLMTAVNYLGIRKTALATRLIVVIVLSALAIVVAANLASPVGSVEGLTDMDGAGMRGVLEAAGLLFFAFAGYARIATLGEEVIDPRRTIPRAIPTALAVTLLVYLAVAVSSLYAVGPAALAASSAPLLTSAEQGLPWAAPLVRIGGAMAALGVLLSLLAGVSRTTFAMARNRELPAWLAAIHPRHHSPYRAELLIGAIVAVVAAFADLREAIGFSSFAVLTYYGIANAAALTQAGVDRRWPKWLQVVGIVGCAVLALSLPPLAVGGGAILLVVGGSLWLLRESRRSR